MVWRVAEPTRTRLGSGQGNPLQLHLLPLELLWVLGQERRFLYVPQILLLSVCTRLELCGSCDCVLLQLSDGCSKPKLCRLGCGQFRVPMRCVGKPMRNSVVEGRTTHRYITTIPPHAHNGTPNEGCGDLLLANTYHGQV